MKKMVMLWSKRMCSGKFEEQAANLALTGWRRTKWRCFDFALWQIYYFTHPLKRNSHLLFYFI